MPQKHEGGTDARFALRWAGLTLSILYGIVSIPLLFFPSVFKLAAYFLTWSEDVPAVSQLLSQLEYYFGVFSYTFGITTLFAAIGGLACSTGIDTFRKRVFGRFFLWLPVIMAVFFFFFLKYF